MSYQYRNLHYKDKTVGRLSYLYNGNSHLWERPLLYWKCGAYPECQQPLPSVSLFPAVAGFSSLCYCCNVAVSQTDCIPVWYDSRFSWHITIMMSLMTRYHVKMVMWHCFEVIMMLLSCYVLAGFGFKNSCILLQVICEITHWDRRSSLRYEIFSPLWPSDAIWCHRTWSVVSGNSLSPVWCQTIIWTNVGPLEMNFSEIWSKIFFFSFNKMHWKTYLWNFRPFFFSPSGDLRKSPKVEFHRNILTLSVSKYQSCCGWIMFWNFVKTCFVFSITVGWVHKALSASL